MQNFLEADYIAGNPHFNGGDMLVVISGCSSAGKSSLLDELFSRGYAVQPEAGRQIVKEQLYIGGDALPWDNAVKFIELCASRAMLHYNSAKPLDKPVLFDRSLIDNVCAFDSLSLPVPEYLRQAVQRYRYAKKVFMAPPWEDLFVADAERRHSFADAEAEYESLLLGYAANGYDTVIIPKAGVVERAAFIEEQLAR